jgi:hypothetical protein
MKVIRTLLTAAAALALGLAVQTAGAAAARYDLAGSYVPASGFPCDVVLDECDSSYSYEGTATCRASCEGAPRTGLFSLELRGSTRVHPQSACISKDVDGTLTFTSTDVSIPGGPPIRVGAVFGNSVDSRGYMIRSVPSSPPIRSFVGLPPNPVRATDTDACTAGPFTGDLELPPNPVIPAG